VNDNEAPVVTCPANTTVNTDNGLCSAVVNYTVTSSDNCQVTSTVQLAGLASGSSFPKGTTVNTFRVTDSSGNTASCSFTVTVDDNEAPVVTCPANATRNTNLSVCTYTVVGTELDATFTDNCPDGSKSNNFNSQNSLGGAILSLGATTIVWTVNDNNGQTATCSFVVTVIDNQGPVIPAIPNTTISTSPTSCFANYTATVGPITDNCTTPDDLNNVVITAKLLENGNNVSLTVTNLPGGNWGIQSLFGLPVGTNEIKVVATDNNGVTSTMTYTVSVQDTWAPIINCPANITVTAGSGACSWPVNWNQPVISDFCPGLSVTSTANSGSNFPVGQTTPVTYYATDGSGNTSSCTFTVTVNGNCIPNPSDLLISYNTPTPQSWATGSCLDVVIKVTNVGGASASGTKQFLLTAMNAWDYNFNVTQTTSTYLGQTVPVQNNQWVVQPVYLGPLFIGLQFSTNEELSPNETISLAVQVCAPNAETTRSMNASLQAGSGGDTNSGNNLARIQVVSE